MYENLDLYDTNIYLYGNKKYISDFTFIFDKMNILGIIENLENEIYDIKLKLLEEKAILIICQFDVNDTLFFLDRIGLKKEKHFFLADDLLYKVDFPIYKISMEKSVFIWGTGEDSHSFFHNFVEKNPQISICGVVDRDINKHKKTFFGKTVYLPEEVINKKNIFLVIATSKYYQEIKEFLIERGYIENINFVDYRKLGNKVSLMLYQTIHDISKTNFVCPKAFEDAYIGKNGVVWICAGANVDSQDENILNSNFKNVWLSKSLQVFRLSVLNGTYTFCNRKKCSYLSEYPEIDVNELHYSFNKEVYDLEKEAKKRIDDLNENRLYIQYQGYPQNIMLAYDATCNLHCRSCRDNVYILPETEKKTVSNITDKVIDLLPYIKKLKMAGDGEVFASKEYQKVLFSDRAYNIDEVGILSNGVLFTKENWNKIEAKYKKISVFISIDGGCKETDEYLRCGTDYNKLESNMDFLAEKKREGKIKKLCFNFVVQKDNYLEMPKFVDQCLKWEADEIKFSPLMRRSGWTEKEFLELSMFDKKGNMKEELKEVISNPIFLHKAVKLFTWVEW